MKNKEVKLLVCLMMFLNISCEPGVKWNPDFYMGDHKQEAIVNEENKIIFANEPEFSKVACLREEKIMELAEILKKARVPKSFIKETFPSFAIKNKWYPN